MRRRFLFIPAMLLMLAALPALAQDEHDHDLEHGRVAPGHAQLGEADDHGAAEHHEATVFAGTIAQSVAAALVFLTLLAVLYKMAWGPILKGLQEREGKIKGDLVAAERASRDAQQTLADYKRQLAESNAEAQRIIERSRTDALTLGAQLKEQTQNEITQMRQRAEADIKAAKEQAITELYTHAAELSTQVASRILRREIRPEDQQQLVRESLDELTRAN